jgi:hypothetical protein
MTNETKTMERATETVSAASLQREKSIGFGYDSRVRVTNTLISASSKKRIDDFVDEFIRSEHVSNLTSERDSDFYNEPERADRCWNAAAHGCDGKTHKEVIDDWRDAFSNWLSDRRSDTAWPERFESAVCARFDAVETWHENNGSLFQEIG